MYQGCPFGATAKSRALKVEENTEKSRMQYHVFKSNVLTAMVTHRSGYFSLERNCQLKKRNTLRHIEFLRSIEKTKNTTPYRFLRHREINYICRSVFRFLN